MSLISEAPLEPFYSAVLAFTASRDASPSSGGARSDAAPRRGAAAGSCHFTFIRAEFLIPLGSAPLSETLSTEFLSEPFDICLPKNVSVHTASRSYVTKARVTPVRGHGTHSLHTASA